MNDDLLSDSQAKEETFVLRGGAATEQAIYDRFMAHYTPFGFQQRADEITYHPMPYKPEPDDKLLLKQPWRIILELYSGTQRMVLGLDLYGDIILGRGNSSPGNIVLNLDEYGAKELGVSRQHLLLRPTISKLYAIDKGSTNGTTVNGSPSGRGVATPLKHEDLIGLGNMVLMVHIVSKPEPPAS